MKITVQESQMLKFGQYLGEACRQGSIIYLNGTLGMGKTTLSRSLVQGLGWQGKVKSPTYTLVEQYDASGVQIYHFDLYRLSDPEELEFIGIRDFDIESAIWLVEWPEKGDGMLPQADLVVTLSEAIEDDGARIIELDAKTSKAEKQVRLLSGYVQQGLQS